ncbi:MAG: hypothetical protein WAW02_02775 [Sideroxyarcus sp.]
MSHLLKLAFLSGILAVVSTSSLARTEIATVAKVGDIYHIEIVTVEQSLIPFHPDKGFFPKIRREVQFVTSGPGEKITVAGHEYQRFVINRDAVTVLDNCVYSEGEIQLSEKLGELIVKGKLSASHSEYTNHSGHYKGVQFLHPAVVSLDKNVVLSTIPGGYVTATGTFGSDRREFVSNGVTYEALDLCVSRNDEQIEIVAHVIVPTSEPRNPYLFVLRKTSEAKHRCCPWGS